jgi:AcrR family transcriptional regulator
VVADETKAKLVEAALETLKEKGFAGSSAREIARTGDLNQALIFYHYGSVQNLLLAALDFVSERRLESYALRFAAARDVGELALLAREIFDEDRSNGYVQVLGEMVGGGVSDPALGTEVVARLQPWVSMVEEKVRELVAGSALAAIVPPRDVAFAIIALYLGIDMLSHLEGNDARAGSLLDLFVRSAPLISTLLGTA